MTLVIGDVLGLQPEVVVDDRLSAGFVLADAGSELRVADGLFGDHPAGTAPEGLLQRVAAPLDLGSGRTLPRLTTPPDLDGRLTQPQGAPAQLDLDVFGAVHFFASGLAEIAFPSLDDLGRQQHRGSVHEEAGTIDHPVGNAHVDALWRAMRVVWPRLERRERRATVVMTHDVDNPLRFTGLSSGQHLRSWLGQVRRGQRPRPLHDLRLSGRVGRGEHAADPYWTFEELLAATERRGDKAILSFIADPRTEGRPPGRPYHLDDAAIRELVADVLERGHEVALHGSWGSHLDASRLTRERDALDQRAADEHRSADVRFGRQHYLLWDPLRTPGIVAEAGLTQDSTLGFADRPGFRTGLCQPHHLYDHERRRTLDVLERPLIAMDQSLVNPKYLGLSPDESLERVARLWDACREHGGEFVVLWHNDQLAAPGGRELWARLHDVLAP